MASLVLPNGLIRSIGSVSQGLIYLWALGESIVENSCLWCQIIWESLEGAKHILLKLCWMQYNRFLLAMQPWLCMIVWYRRSLLYLLLVQSLTNWPQFSTTFAQPLSFTIHFWVFLIFQSAFYMYLHLSKFNRPEVEICIRGWGRFVHSTLPCP